MEELKIVMEALARMGEGATTAFIIWCVKDFAVYLVFPLTCVVIGFLAKMLMRTASTLK